MARVITTQTISAYYDPLNDAIICVLTIFPRSIPSLVYIAIVVVVISTLGLKACMRLN